MATSSTSDGRIFFQGLDELRALASLAVVVHHVELYKHRGGIASLYESPLAALISNLGEHGVHTFFVLSGFLITYLLLVEKEKYSRIDLAKFYFRRALRIWPVYYLTLFLSFWVVPVVAHRVSALQAETYYFSRVVQLQDSFILTLSLFILFLPNLALLLKPPVVGASQAWSIGVEEQFYLIWPQLVQRLSGSILLCLFVMIAIVYPCAGQLLSLVMPRLGDFANLAIKLLPIHLMAIGAFGSTVLFQHSRPIEGLLKSKIMFSVASISLVTSLCFKVPATVFAILVMFVITFVIQEGFRFNLRSRILRRIGVISYGVYMYHSLVMYVCFAAANSVLAISTTSAVYHTVVYLSVLALTLLVSTLSYTFIERPFIEYKKTWLTVVASGSRGER